MDNKKCLKCNISKCKAQCCYWVPFPIKFLEAHADKMIRPVYGIACNEHNDKVGQAITHVETKIVDGKEQNIIEQTKQKCPFLTDDNKCNIYKIRPELCRCFGTKLSEDHPFTCHFHLGKNYHFPDKNTPEYAKINNVKYFVSDYLNNKRLMKQMFPDEDLNEIISVLKQKLQAFK